MHVNAVYLAERARVGAVGGDELRHDGEGLGRVDGHARAVERVVAHAVRVEVAAVLVAAPVVAVRAHTARRVGSADRLARFLADVRRDGRRDLVGFPDVHLVAAAALATRAGVGVVGRWGPVEDVGLCEVSAVDH